MNIYKVIFFSIILSLNQQVMSSDVSEDMEIGDDSHRGQKRNWDKMDSDEIDLGQRFDLSKYFPKKKKQKLNPVMVEVEPRGRKRNRDEMDLDETNLEENESLDQKMKQQKIEHIVTVEDFSRLRSLIPPEYVINYESPFQNTSHRNK